MPSIYLRENPFQIGVFGSGSADDKCYKLAYEVGASVARQGHIVSQWRTWRCYGSFGKRGKPRPMVW